MKIHHTIADLVHELDRAENKHLGVPPPTITADMLRDAAIEAERHAERRYYEGYHAGCKYADDRE